MTEAEIAWLAGIIEGEGSIYWDKRSKNSVRISVSMTDEDVVRRIHALVGVGAVSVKTRPTVTGKLVYRWDAGHKLEVRPLLVSVRPWMGLRRGAKIDEAIARIDSMAGITGPKARSAA